LFIWEPTADAMTNGVSMRGGAAILEDGHGVIAVGSGDRSGLSGAG